MPVITIDGVSYEVEAGRNLLESCLTLGLFSQFLAPTSGAPRQIQCRARQLNNRWTLAFARSARY